MSRWASNGGNHRAGGSLWRKEVMIFPSAVPPCTSSLVKPVNIVIQHRGGILPLPLCFLWEGSADEELCQLFFFFYSAVTCLWRKLNFQKVWVFVLFATDEDKPLQTLYSEALTAWFNLNPILLILIVAPAYRAQGNEKMSFSCSSFRPSPESHGHTYFKFKDKIIRGCFVEGTLYLNRIKELCRDKVALWDVGSMFRVVYLVDFTASTFHTDVN